MSKQYGTFDLSASTLTIIAIMAVVTLAVTVILDRIENTYAFIPLFIVFCLIAVLVITFWTTEPLFGEFASSSWHHPDTRTAAGHSWLPYM